MGIKETPKRPYKGWHNDNSPVDQPKDTYRHAWNAILQTEKGDKNFVTNEMGNKLCTSIPETYKPIGSVYIGDDQLVIFSTNGDRSEIGILDRNCTYDSIVNSACLNFQISSQIDAVFRVRQGCERTIYWTDNLNPVRYFNFEKQDDFKLGTPTPTEIWDCTLFNLFLGYTVPCFTAIDVLEQGNLKSGSYNFAIQYLDQDLNPTRWIYTSQTVPIFRSKLTESYDAITGSSNFESDDLGGISSATNKAIRISLGSLDPRYSFYRIAVIEATGFNGLVTTAFVSAEISASQTQFTYDGNLQGFTPIAVEEIILQPEPIEVAAHIEQIENRLILSNVKGKQVNFCDFQKFASKIGSKYVVREAPAKDVELGNPKDPNTYWQRLGYMGDEIYAMGIVYVFKDGTPSPAFHIPGAPKDHRIDPTTNGCVSVGDNDSQLITSWSEDVAHIYATPGEFQDIERWKVFNTAIATSSSDGHFSYWEASNAIYSNVIDCQGKDYWGKDICNNTLTGSPIRHHKFPNRNLVPHYDATVDSKYEVTLRVELCITTGAPLDPALGPYTLTVNYEIDSVPYSLDISIDATLFDTDGYCEIYQIVVAQVDDPLDAFITSYTGNIGADPNFSKTDVSYDSQGQITIEDFTTINQLGVQFFNIIYPHPDIVGHYFVRAERDGFNKTVLDKGISNPLHESSAKGQDFTIFSYFYGGPASAIGGPIINRSDTYNYFFTPNLHFLNDAPDGSYLSQENEFNANGWAALYGNKDTGEEFDNRTEFAPAEGGAVFGKTYATLISTRQQGYQGLTGTGNKNRSIEKSLVLNGLTQDDTFVPGQKLFNTSHTNRVQVAELSSSLKGVGRNLPYIALKVNRDVFTDLYNLKYYRSHNCMFDQTNSQIVFGGDTAISRWDISNTLYFQFHNSVWNEILIGVGIVVAAVATVFTAGFSSVAIAGLIGVAGSAATVAGIQTAIIVTAIVAGAVGVTATQITAIIEAYRSTGLMQIVTQDAELESASFSTKNFIEYANEHMSNLYVESTINIALRQDHIIYDGGDFYRRQRDIREYFRDKIMYFDPQETANKRQYKLRGAVIPEIYHYNLDFSRMNKESQYFPIPTSFNCCSPCIFSHPGRVHYSQQSFQEESVDNYRVFLAQNYRDIEGEHGEITNIFRLKNNLYIHTDEALWLLPQNIQERVTGDVVAFIGTGEYFSIPPRLVVDDDLGSGGTQDKWAYVKTTYGVFFVDQLNSTVYQVQGDGGLKSITAGISSWLETRLISFLGNQYYDNSKSKYPFLGNPANPNGVGIHLSFDTWFERVILTKRDYLCLTPFEVVTSDNNGQLPELLAGEVAFDIRVNRWIVGTGINQYIEIELDNPQYFENKSFTISYALESQAWVSQHSYIPLMYMRTPTFWYSFKDNQIWQHNIVGKYQSYYGDIYKHVLEYVSLTSPLATTIPQHIRLQTLAQKYSSANDTYYDIRDITFTQVILYNSRQCSGRLNLKVKTQTEDYLQDQVTQLSNQDIIISRNERDWTFNDFVDYRNDYDSPIWTREWASLQSEFPTDKVLTNTIDFNKEWYTMEEFRDKYLVIRLEFTNFEDVQLITNYTSELEEDSFR